MWIYDERLHNDTGLLCFLWTIAVLMTATKYSIIQFIDKRY